ncbi:MAG: gamma-glutamyltransferase [bacterium]
MNNRFKMVAFCLGAVLLAALLVVGAACDHFRVSHLYTHGVVVSAAPGASQAGLQILESGGNAFDAAVAVALALAVVHPEAGNLGGGGFALLRVASDQRVKTLDFRETAPAGASESMYLDAGGEVIAEASTYGALAAGVPGTVAGLYELWRSHGSLEWNQLVAPAIALARDGFEVDLYLANSLTEHAQELAGFASTAEQFLPDGRVPQAGDTLYQPDLSLTLRSIAAGGRDGFYTGDVARQIVDCMATHGGLISLDDLAAYEPVWRAPVTFHFDSFTVYSMPPPSSGGLCIGQILSLMEPADFSRMSPSSPDYLHRFAEAARLAFADRSEHLGDPAYYSIPGGLLDSAYLAARGKLMDSVKAGRSENILPGLPENMTESDQTTHFCVCDSLGNMVSLTYTLNTSYGCKLVVEGAGFLLNNEMDDFSIKPGHANVYGLVGGQANKIEAGKRMLSSMAPTLVFNNEQPYLILGTPGGSKIITVVAQAILNMTRFGLDLDQCVAQARFHHQWLPDVLWVELGGYDINVIQELIRRGYDVRECEPYSDLQVIQFTGQGMLRGASDPRGNGAVAGF